MVQRLAVVGIGAPGEQDARETRLVRDAGGAIERALFAELGMRVRRIRIGARVEQALGRRDERVAARSTEVARVRDVEKRLPAEWGQGRPWIDVHRRSQHECRGGERAHDRRVGLEQGVCVVDPIGGRGTHERLGALAQARRLPLGAPDERGPARLAELARHRELRGCELQLAGDGLDPRQRLRFTRPRGREQRLRLAACTPQIDSPYIHCDHLHAQAVRRRRAEVIAPRRTCSCLSRWAWGSSRGPVAPSRAAITLAKRGYPRFATAARLPSWTR